MPVTVIEACAFGLPVVATKVGGIGCLLEDGTNGLLVPADDPEKMAKAVVRLLEDPGLVRRISENGRSLAERSSWRSVQVQWEDLFADMGLGRLPRGESSATSLHGGIPT
jgi:glycosyltransferase involved in cell wall biosynthesis